MSRHICGILADCAQGMQEINSMQAFEQVFRNRPQ
jgi:hypothetical protein